MKSKPVFVVLAIAAATIALAPQARSAIDPQDAQLKSSIRTVFKHHAFPEPSFVGTSRVTIRLWYSDIDAKKEGVIAWGERRSAGAFPAVALVRITPERKIVVELASVPPRSYSLVDSGLGGPAPWQGWREEEARMEKEIEEALSRYVNQLGQPAAGGNAE